MTPCEELGYKVGDEFVLSNVRDSKAHRKGKAVRLSKDDGTEAPYFYPIKQDKEMHHWCHSLDEVKPLRITLQPGDYIATADLSEEDYHNVARSFMAAGCDDGEYPRWGYARDGYLHALGWHPREDILFHGDITVGNTFSGGRQLTLTQILSATNAGGVETESTTENTTDEQPMPKQHLADQLEAALSALEQAQSEVDRLQAEYRAAYPKIHGEVVPTEDMNEPANWRAGDVVETINDSTNYFKGSHVKIHSFDKDGDLILEQDADKRIGWGKQHFRFVRRP